MHDYVVYSAGFALVALLTCQLARPFDRRLATAFAVLFAIYLGLDDLVTSLGARFDIFGGDWNWSGKLYSLALSAVAMLALRLRPEAAGLQLPRRGAQASLVAMLALLLPSIALALLFEPEAPSAETLAFQATLPGLAEELAYRGIAPALLLGLVAGRTPPRATPWAVVYVTALMFGVWHGLHYANGAFAFEWIPALYTCVGGMVYGWMRFYSGSLLFPVLAHCLGNTAFQLVPLLRG